MRLFTALVCFCLLSIQSTNAATYVFTSPGSNIHIDGRITGPTGDWNLWITPGVSFTGPDVGPSNPYETYDQFIGYNFSVYGNGILIFFACASNQGAHCAYPWNYPSSSSILVSSYFDGHLAIDAGFGGTQIAPNPLEISLSLPDGYIFSDNYFFPSVPESSTWAMLLIGFAVIGFATYRRRQKPQYVC
jgi:hypothetical protein